MEAEQPQPSLSPQTTLTYILLYTLTTFVNKYVLSVLKFTYPTIFQGWQMLVAAILLRVLGFSGRLNPAPSLTNVNRSVFIQWFPALMFHIINIYTGSVALAQLPIPVFIALHNIQCVLASIANQIVGQYLSTPDSSTSPTRVRKVSERTLSESSDHGMETGITTVPIIRDLLVVKRVLGRQQPLMMGVLIISVIFIILSDTTSNTKGYYWMGVHLISSGCYLFYERLKGHSIPLGGIDRLYINCLVSCIVLAPFTYLLGDLIAAKEFPFLYFYKFYMGCLASGILGTFTGVTGVKIKEGHLGVPLLGQLKVYAKMCAAVSSLLVFGFADSTPTAEHAFWLGLNLVVAILCEESSANLYVDVSQQQQHEFPGTASVNS